MSKPGRPGFKAAVLVTLIIGSLATTLFAGEADYQEPPLTQTERQHWSFKPILRPKLPELADAKGWCRGGIDRFILLQLDEKKSIPADEASRETLLRRLTFDLTGLPPTFSEMEAFTNDNEPDACERLVDRLLASPAYGERWGQHWLDLARFAETDGYEHDLVRKEAWRYRDWVVGALNADLPYDEFVRQQVAGDEEGDRGQGTGDKIESQASDFKSEISDGSKPKQTPLTRSSIPTMFCLSGPDMPDINSQEQRKHELLNEVAGTIGSVFMGLQIGCAQCHDHKYDPLSQADFYRLRAFFEPAVSLQKDVSVIALLTDDKFKSPARIWIRGDWQRPGMEVQPAMVRVLLPASGGREPPDTTSADIEPNQKNQGADAPRSPRTNLARWLTSPDHPLTSRVMVNRLWQHHFGKGIVESPSDFGVMGTAPSNPDQLDWLASELMSNGWSLKKLHRRMVCSATYRQASRRPRRLEGEAIRDAMLAASGQLDFRRGGPGVMPPLPEELTKTLLPNHWKASKNPADAVRRSIYIFARRNLRYPLFEAFDRPDPNASCPLRSRSTTATQSLLLFNSDFSLSCAKHLAAEILRDAPEGVTSRITATCRRIWGRSPSDSELKTLTAFLAQQEELLRKAASAPDAALVDLCLALFNTNEFLYLD
ncbi:MAG: DUF1549 and DUF1553 domain-containing protein [Pirellulaceae bacterium]